MGIMLLSWVEGLFVLRHFVVAVVGWIMNRTVNQLSPLSSAPRNTLTSGVHFLLGDVSISVVGPDRVGPEFSTFTI